MAGIDSATVLMLHCDGVDEATSFPDASASSHTVTANGTAQVDTAQQQFGTASCLLDGNSDYLTIPDSADWDLSGDFTLECWIRPSAVTGTRAVMLQQESASELWAMFFTATTLNFTVISSQASVSVAFSTSFSINTWAHIAIVRSGNNYYGFKNGVLLGTERDETEIPNLTGSLSVGALIIPVSTFFAGHIDEVKISQTARWINDFTVQSAAYSALSGGGTGYNKFAQNLLVLTAPFDGVATSEDCYVQSIHWDAGGAGAGETADILDRGDKSVISFETNASQTIFKCAKYLNQRTKGIKVNSLTDGTLYIYKT